MQKVSGDNLTMKSKGGRDYQSRPSHSSINVHQSGVIVYIDRVPYHGGHTTAWQWYYRKDTEHLYRNARPNNNQL